MPTTAPSTQNPTPRQVASTLAGIAVIATLLALPDASTHLFWNLMIPTLPAVVTLWPGVWRNVCPLGSTAALTRSFAPNPGRAMSLSGQGIATFGSVALLAALLPLRRLGFDLSGPATALMLVAAGTVAVTLAARFSGKSGWCATLCPVNAVERLYGQAPLGEGTNSHCTTCSHCVAVCPDSVRSMAPLRATPTRWHRLADTLMAGGFFGFVWGWFHVPPTAGDFSPLLVARAYLLPLGTGALSLLIFLMIVRVPSAKRAKVVRAFAATTLACYYWYRLPALLGFGLFAGDGVLLDLSSVFSPALPTVVRIASLALIALHWVTTNRKDSNAWLTRPPAEPQLVTLGAGRRAGVGYRVAA